MDIGTLTGAIELDDRLSAVLDQIDAKLKNIEKVAATSMQMSASKMTLAVVAGNLLSNALETVVQKSIAFGKQLFDSSIMAGARLETLGQVSRFLGERAGYAATFVDDLSKKIEATGITATDSREAIVNLLEKHIDLSKAAQLSAVAQNMAVVSGRGSSDTFAMMVNVLGTLNSRMIRTAGFTFSLEQATAAYREETGKLSGELTLTEKRLAVTNAMIKEGEQFAGLYALAMGTASKQVGSAERAWKQVGETLGQILLPITTLVIQAWYDLASQMKIVMNRIQTAVGPTLTVVADYVKTLVGRLTEFGSNAFPVVITAIQNFVAYLLDLNERFSFTDNLIKGAKAAWEVLKYAFNLVADAVKAVIAAWQSMPDWLKSITKGALESAAVLGAYSLVIGAVATPFSMLISKIDLGINIIGNFTGAVFAMINMPWAAMVTGVGSAYTFLTGVLASLGLVQVKVAAQSVVLTGAAQFWTAAAVPATGATTALSGAFIRLWIAVGGPAIVAFVAANAVIVGVVAVLVAGALAVRAFTGSWDFLLGPLKKAWGAVDDIRVILWEAVKIAGEWAKGAVFTFVEGLVDRVKSAVSGLVEVWGWLKKIDEALPKGGPSESKAVGEDGKPRPTNFDGWFAGNAALRAGIDAKNEALKAEAEALRIAEEQTAMYTARTEAARIETLALAKSLDTVAIARAATSDLGGISKGLDELLSKGPVAKDVMTKLVDNIRKLQAAGGVDVKLGVLADEHDVAQYTELLDLMKKQGPLADGAADKAKRLAERIREIMENSGSTSPALKALAGEFDVLGVSIEKAVQKKLWDDDKLKTIASMVETVRKANFEADAPMQAYDQIIKTPGGSSVEAQKTTIPILEQQIALGATLNAQQQAEIQLNTTRNQGVITYGVKLLETQGITLEMVEAQKAMGLSTHEIARGYGVVDAALDRHTGKLSSVQDLIRRYATEQLKLTGTLAEQATAAREQEYQDTIKSLDNQAVLARGDSAKLDEIAIKRSLIMGIHKMQTEQANLDMDSLHAKDMRNLGEKLAAEQKKLEFMQANAFTAEGDVRYTPEAIQEQYGIVAAAAEAAAGRVEAAHGQALDSVLAKTKGTVTEMVDIWAAHKGLLTSPGIAEQDADRARRFAEGRQWSTPNPTGNQFGAWSAQKASEAAANMFKPSGEATGGYVDANAMKVVGERGPETFIPSNSGTVIPAGGGGVQGNSVIINAQGSFFGANERQVTRTLEDMLAKSGRQTTKVSRG